MTPYVLAGLGMFAMGLLGGFVLAQMTFVVRAEGSDLFPTDDEEDHPWPYFPSRREGSHYLITPEEHAALRATLEGKT